MYSSNDSSGARINKTVQICMEHQCPTMEQQWKPRPVGCTHGNMNLKGISFLAQSVAVELFLIKVLSPRNYVLAVSLKQG